MTPDQGVHEPTCHGKPGKSRHVTSDTALKECQPRHIFLPWAGSDCPAFIFRQGLVQSSGHTAKAPLTKGSPARPSTAAATALVLLDEWKVAAPGRQAALHLLLNKVGLPALDEPWDVISRIFISWNPTKVVSFGRDIGSRAR